MIRPGLIFPFIALLGITLSGLTVAHIYDQDLAVEKMALSRAIDINASLVDERLKARELQAQVASFLLRNSPAPDPSMSALRIAVDAFTSDFTSLAWIERVKPSELENARARLHRISADLDIRDNDDKPLNLAGQKVPVNLVMDIEPHNDETIKLLGRSIESDPIRRDLQARARSSQKALASDPTPLMGSTGVIGIILAVPVIYRGGAEPAGFLNFGFNLGTLMLTNDDSSLFSVAVRPRADESSEFVANDQGVVSSRALTAGGPQPTVSRPISFGGRDFVLNYYVRTSLGSRAWQRGVVVGASGLLITVMLTVLFGVVARNNLRLHREIEVRIGFEHRLNAVIDELNHRVRNILAVMQSIVTRTMRHGTDMDVVREQLVGRIHAMSNVVSLLSESRWQGVSLQGLFEPRAIPNVDRINVSGPDFAVSARAAQSLSLLFYELASHSDEGLSLVGQHPHIDAKWTIGEGPDGIFQFRWEEFNTSEATRRPDSDFGLILLDRVAPEALGGTAKRYFTDVSYVYELTAPMETVVDMAERDRTQPFSAPVRPAG